MKTIFICEKCDKHFEKDNEARACEKTHEKEGFFQSIACSELTRNFIREVDKKFAANPYMGDKDLYLWMAHVLEIYAVEAVKKALKDES